MIETGTGFVGEPPVLALDRDGKLDEQTLANLSLFLKAAAAALNGGLRLGPTGPPLYDKVDAPAGVSAPNNKRAGNLAGYIMQYYFLTGGTIYTVKHDLGRIPLGIITLQVNQSGAVVRGTNPTEWTDSSFKLECNVNATYATFIVV
jgi:hypothetical protein